MKFEHIAASHSVGSIMHFENTSQKQQTSGVVGATGFLLAIKCHQKLKAAVKHASVRGSKGSSWLLKYCGQDVIWQMKAHRTTGSLLVQPYQTVWLHTSFQLQAASSNETHGKESGPMKQHEDM